MGFLIGGFVKFLGYHNAGCQCHYCIGPNGGSKKNKRALTKRGRQDLKKDLNSRTSDESDLRQEQTGPKSNQE